VKTANILADVGVSTNCQLHSRPHQSTQLRPVSHSEPLLLEMLAKRLWHLGNRETARPDRGNIHAHTRLSQKGNIAHKVLLPPLEKYEKRAKTGNLYAVMPEPAASVA
jgi:hypothetical protein